MNTLRIIRRAGVIFFFVSINAFWYAWGSFVLVCQGKPKEARRLLFAARVLKLFRDLGATFIKLGQIMSTRPDLFPPELIQALVQLQDNVGPFRFVDVQQIIEVDFSSPLHALFAEFDSTPVASASVAQVHKARLRDGTLVAVKVRRPHIEELCTFDVAVMRVYAHLLNFIPSISLLAPVESLDQFAQAIKMQLDFAIEAQNNRRFQKNFADQQDVFFPKLYEHLCTHRVLTMEFIEGTKILDYAKTGANPKRLGKIGFQTMLKMVFLDGFVHADLHPGNILIAKDQRLALLDLGMVAELDNFYRLVFLRYFAAWAHGEGRSMAEILLEHSPSRYCAEPEKFKAAIESFVSQYQGKRLGEVQVAGVVYEMLQILRKFRIRINPTFTMVNIAIALTEGIGKQLDPQLDLLKEALPFFSMLS